MAQKEKKRLHPYKEGYDERFGIRITTWNGDKRNVTSCVCQFCESFGRENEDVGSSQTSRQRKKTENTKHFKNAFRPENIRKHMAEQHPKKWKEYQDAYANRKQDHLTFANFFKQSVIPAYFEKQSVFDGGKLLINISKKIVEVAIKELLFDDDEEIAGDMAVNRFEPVFANTEDGMEDNSNIVSYRVVVKNRIQFDYVVALLAKNLSFRQISGVIKENRDLLGTVAKTGYASHGDVSTISRIVCASALQMITHLLKASWAFAIGADVSTDSYGNSYLATRIRLAPTTNHTEELQSFHFLAIPLFDESHTGENLFETIAKLLSAVCESWPEKIIGSTTDGAANMTGSVKGFSTRLQAASSSPSFYRIWCLAHQLNLVVEQAVVDTSELEGFDFLQILKTTTRWLRKQVTLVQSMNSSCPYFNEIRWTALEQILRWYTNHREQIEAYFTQKKYTSAPPKIWWLLAYVLQYYFQPILVAFNSLQVDASIVERQYNSLKLLFQELQQQVNSDRNKTADPESRVANGDEQVCNHILLR